MIPMDKHAENIISKTGGDKREADRRRGKGHGQAERCQEETGKQRNIGKKTSAPAIAALF